MVQSAELKLADATASSRGFQHGAALGVALRRALQIVGKYPKCCSGALEGFYGNPRYRELARSRTPTRESWSAGPGLSWCGSSAAAWQLSFGTPEHPGVTGLLAKQAARTGLHAAVPVAFGGVGTDGGIPSSLAASQVRWSPGRAAAS